MKTYWCNISKINEDIDSFVIAKNKIESDLIECNTISSKMSIKDFLGYFDLTHKIYSYQSEIMFPFYIYHSMGEDGFHEPFIVVLYSSEVDDEDKINDFKHNLEKIDFDTDNLTKIPESKLLDNRLNESSYFIIDYGFYESK